MSEFIVPGIGSMGSKDIQKSGWEKSFKNTKSCAFNTEVIPWSTRVAILCPLVDVIHIVDPKLGRLHLFPAWREPFPLQRVAPVCSVSVVVNVVLPATDGPVNGPAGRKGEVLSR